MLALAMVFAAGVKIWGIVVFLQLWMMLDSRLLSGLWTFFTTDAMQLIQRVSFVKIFWEFFLMLYTLFITI